MMDVRRRESVCRSLFGPVDRDQLRRDFQLRMKEMTEQDSRRWNFNFQSEKPLPGRFQWEETSADCAASCAQLRSDVQERLGINQENCLSISNTPKSSEEETCVQRKRRLSKPAASSAQITDFFAKRRSAGIKSISRSLSSSSEEAQCRTIR